MQKTTKTLNYSDGDEVNAAVIDALIAENKNVLVSIGWTGIKRCFLNMRWHDIKMRYETDIDGNCDLEGEPIQAFGLADEFVAYEISEK